MPQKHQNKENHKIKPVGFLIKSEIDIRCSTFIIDFSILILALLPACRVAFKLENKAEAKQEFYVL